MLIIFSLLLCTLGLSRLSIVIRYSVSGPNVILLFSMSILAWQSLKNRLPMMISGLISITQTFRTFSVLPIFTGRYAYPLVCTTDPSTVLATVLLLCFKLVGIPWLANLSNRFKLMALQVAPESIRAFAAIPSICTSMNISSSQMRVVHSFSVSESSSTFNTRKTFRSPISLLGALVGGSHVLAFRGAVHSL